ncbi:helix-turn-helix domain-containing protein [Neisseriaceae bacterium JH1-16]|nr:helix-turn-helix domain-containing protein [Neisseriaceae bacterium JH1-16]
MNNDIVAVVAFDNIIPFHLSVPCIVFGEDRRALGLPQFDLRVCSTTPGPLPTTAGFSINAPYGLDGLVGAGTVIVPSWHDTTERPPEALLEALHAAHRAGARLVGLCLGAIVLAEAGLLDGRPATTHWRWAEQFAQQYPRVRLNPDVLYIDDGDILTSAGVAAGLDCCLHLVRQRCGAELANRLARLLVVPPHREGGQAQFIERPLPQNAGGARLNAALLWAEQHLAEPLDVDALAEQALMSRRSFTRHFRQATGQSVGQWLLGRRLALAQRLLETGDWGIERIAAEAGFGSAVTLRQRFAQAFDTSPAAYRRHFRGN